MKQKKNKKSKVDNKFNFDNDVIIGISSNNSDSKNKSHKKNKKKNNKKNIVNSSKNKKTKVKPNKVKKKHSLFYRIGILGVFIIGGICFLVLSPMFNIKEIVVEDNEVISEEKIISLSGVTVDENIFRISKSSIRKNVENEPYIESVNVKRVFPNRLEIIVEERVPRFLVEYTDGKYIYIDKNGYVLEFSNEKLELPILIGTSTEFESMIDTEGNENRLNEKDLKRLNVVLKIISIAESNEILDLITKIDFSDSSDYKLVLDSIGKIVHLGDCNDLNTRILWAKEIINSEKDNRGEIFVNSNEKPPFFRESI